MLDITPSVPSTMVSDRSPIEQYWSTDQVNVIERLIAPGLTPDELVVFAHVCQKVNLDPFAKQIYAIKRGGRMCIQTGIDGFRLVAERTGKYSPGADTQFIYDENRGLLGAKVFVKKLTADGTWHQISATAFFSEYNGGRGLWGKMPHVMLEKCAEARALRRAFPADLSGLYSEDEMDQAAVVVKAPSRPVIGKETAAGIDVYIDGHDEIREALLKLCGVKKIEDILETQLEACRNFVRSRKTKIQEGEKTTKPSVLEFTSALVANDVIADKNPTVCSPAKKNKGDRK